MSEYSSDNPVGTFAGGQTPRGSLFLEKKIASVSIGTRKTIATVLRLLENTEARLLENGEFRILE
jgi:hypothetical protein